MTTNNFLFISIRVLNGNNGRTLNETKLQKTEFDNIDDLYADCIAKYGCCVKNTYTYTKNGKYQQLGWVFVKTVQYSGLDDKYYSRQTWVEVSTTEPHITPVFN